MFVIKIIYCLIMTSSMLLSQATFAQEVKSKTRMSVPSEREGFDMFTIDKGELVSLKGTIVTFGPEIDQKGVLMGYKYDAKGLEGIVEGDTIPLFIHDLDYSLDPRGGGCLDTENKKVDGCVYAPSIKGAFKPVTVKSNRKSGNSLVIVLSQPVKLGKGALVEDLRFVSKEGWYLFQRPRDGM